MSSSVDDDRFLLLPLRQTIAEKGLGVQAIHVHRAGHEDLEYRYIEDRELCIYSCTKTVTALAIGIAQAEGLLTVEDRLVDHLPAPEGGYGAGVEEITLRHLITMTGGSPILIFEDWQREHPAVTDLYLGTDLVRAPGEKFEYSNGGLHLLGRTVEQAAGTSLRDYLLPRLFAPLGIVNPQWFTDREGHTLGATGLHLKTHQLARIGRLLLQRGAWDGQQLVPAEWVDRMHAEDSWVPTGDLDPESGQYGFGNWRNTIPGSFRADGAYGQFVLVLPEQDTVVTITSHQEGTPAQEIIRAVWRDLLPAL